MSRLVSISGGTPLGGVICGPDSVVNEGVVDSTIPARGPNDAV